MRPNNLSVMAARVLNLLDEYGEEFASLRPVEQCDLIGTTRTQTLSDAKIELQRKGYIHLESRNGISHVIVSRSYKYVVCMLYRTDADAPVYAQLDNNNLSNGHHPNTLPLTYPNTSALPLLIPQHVAVDVPQRESVEVEEPQHVAVVVMCRDADDLEDDGDIALRNSNAQTRRKKQIPLIQAAYQENFPQDTYPLTERMAKDWLTLNENSAVQVVEALGEIQHLKPELESPKAYISAAFRGSASRRAMISAPTPAKDPRNEPAPKFFDGELMEPSPEFREKQRRAKELAKKIWREDE